MESRGKRCPAMDVLAYFDEGLGGNTETEGRRGRKKRATARRIFKSAIELMHTDGFDGVTIEQICERADVARATFFQHFANKAALTGFLSVVACQRIERELSVAKLDPEGQLTLIADHLQKLTEELGAIAPAMLSAFVSQPGGGFRVHEAETGIAHLIVDIVREGQASGRFSNEWPPEAVAISLVSSWVGISRASLSYGEGAHTGPPFHSILRLFMNGLTRR